MDSTLQRMYFPKYQDSSLVNLMSRLAQTFGVNDHPYPPLAHPSLTRLTEYQHVVLLVIDGMGARYVDSHPGFLRAHLCGELTSVFPTTTATAITTFMTGLAPQQHGLTGWFTYLKEIGAITAVLPCQLRGSREPLSERGIDIESLYGHTPFFDSLNVPSTVLAPAWIVDSPFNIAHSGDARRIGYTDLDSMFAGLHKALQNPERQYIYAYWPEFDRLSHLHGNASEQVARHYRDLEAALAKFIDAHTGTGSLLLITADHGFIDTRPERMINLNQYPVLQDCLSLPLSGEPRVAYCYVHPHKSRTFVDYIQEHFADKIELVESQTLIEQGAFGAGEPHPKLAQRVGDYTLIMQDNFIIKDWLAGEKPFFHYGVHGGVSEREMQVPLIVIAND
ncbi:MAG: phosphodiesterase [Gammaproteobacteria bacterium]|nr:phosphodiesterase [Gammaproteobacteria bacterium]